MTLNVEIPELIEAKLAEKARASGVDLLTYARRVLQADALLPSLDEILKPVHDKFARTGMSIDEAADLYEAQKHAAREARNGKPLSE